MVEAQTTGKQASPLSESSNRVLIRFLHWMFGTIQHVPIRSSELDRKVRVRYRQQIEQLTSLGFDYLCSDGEGFALFRLLFLLPAVFLVLMLVDRLPMTISGGLILTGWPVLVCRKNSTFATSPDGRRVKFLTLFQDGTLLVSGNYETPLSTRPGIVSQCKAGTISDAWAAHLGRMQSIEFAGTQIDRRSGYEAYVEISDRDTAAW
jgi:hypothetical protein